MDERQVAVLELLEVAEHLVLGPVALERGVVEEAGRAGQRAVVAGAVGLGHERAAEGVDEVGEVGVGDGLVERDPDRPVGVAPEVDRVLVAGERDHVLAVAQADAQGVEKGAVDDLVAGRLERPGQPPRLAVDVLGDGRQPVGPVVDGVEPGDVGQEHLGRADVARRLLAADVLLARLQRHPQRRVAVPVLADADDPAGDLARERVGGGEERRVGAAEAHRHAEPLAGAQRHVRAPGAGRLDERQAPAGRSRRRGSRRRRGRARRGRRSRRSRRRSWGTGRARRCSRRRARTRPGRPPRR